MSTNEPDPSSQPSLPLDHKPITEIEIGAGQASKTRISKGGAAIRSTVRPGAKPSAEPFPTKDSKLRTNPNFSKPEGIAAEPSFSKDDSSKSESEPVTASEPGARKTKPFERKPNTKVFVPFGGVLAEEQKSGPSAGLVVVVLVVLSLGGWGFYHFFGGKKKSAPQTIELAKPEQEQPVSPPVASQTEGAPESSSEATSSSPEPSPSTSPTISASPTPDAASMAAVSSPLPTPTVEPTPLPAKPKFLVEPLHIPEESSALAKVSSKAPELIAKAQGLIDENEKTRQQRLQAQQQAIADLKAAQEVADKANADLLLKQAQANEAEKGVSEATSSGEEKQRAKQQAQAEAARFQAVASQINSLKQERAMETDAPTSDSRLADPTLDPAAMIEELPDTPSVTATTSAAAAPATALENNAKELVNSLGMKFVLIDDVRFCIWLTRVKDYEAYAQAVGARGAAWKQPGFSQTPEDPVVNVSWKEATAFCKWLTAKEHKEGTLPNELVYRLPTDAEWSKAAGLPFEKGRSAQSRDKDVPGFYPWGKQWPPSPGVGNFTGEETGQELALKGYNDGYAWTSPVGSFPSNEQGLFDMGGNASQWCMDWWNEEKTARVIRGSSWANSASEESLLSSARLHAAPESATNSCGFRCVIATEGYQ